MVLTRLRNKLKSFSFEIGTGTNLVGSFAGKGKSDGSEDFMSVIEAAMSEGDKSAGQLNKEYRQRLGNLRDRYLEKIRKSKYDSQTNQHVVEMKYGGKKGEYAISELTFFWCSDIQRLSKKSEKHPRDLQPVVFQVPGSKTRYIIHDDTPQHSPLNREMFIIMGYISNIIKTDIKQYDSNGGEFAKGPWTVEKRVEIFEYFRIWSFLSYTGYVGTSNTKRGS